MSWSRSIYSSWSDIFETCWRRLAKTFSKRLQDVFKTSCKNVFKTSSRRLQDVFKTSSRRVAKMSSRNLQDVSSSLTVFVDTFSRWLRDIFKTFLRRTPKTVNYRRIPLGHTSEKFMVSVQNLQGWQRFLKFWFLSLLHLLVAADRGAFLEPGEHHNGAFFAKILHGFKLLNIFARSAIAGIRLGWK